MEQIAVFQEKVSLSPLDLRDDVTSFDEILLSKLKKKLEGKCSKHGFVIPGSLQLLSRGMGVVEMGRATSDFMYYLKAQGKVYNPPDGFMVDGDIMLKNKMGCYVILNDAVRIMIPRDLHIGNEEFDSLEVGDRIRIEIKRSQFRSNATHILSIGQYIGKAGEAPGSLAALYNAVEEVSENKKNEEKAPSSLLVPHAEEDEASDSDEEEEE